MAVKVNKILCSGCGLCEEACPAGAITINDATGKAKVNKYLCVDCGVCINECKEGALSIKLTNTKRKKRRI